MPFIDITVEGLEETISGLNNIEISLQSARMQALQEVSEFMANEMRNNAHVITGQMKASITSMVVGDTATVEVSAPYAAYENARVGGPQGPHDFADRAIQATNSMAPEMIKRSYDTVL